MTHSNSLTKIWTFPGKQKTTPAQIKYLIFSFEVYLHAKIPDFSFRLFITPWKLSTHHLHRYPYEFFAHISGIARQVWPQPTEMRDPFPSFADGHSLVQKTFLIKEYCNLIGWEYFTQELENKNFASYIVLRRTIIPMILIRFNQTITKLEKNTQILFWTRFGPIPS